MVDQVEVQPQGRGTPLGTRLRAWARSLGRARVVWLLTGAAIAVLWAGIGAAILHQRSTAMADDRQAGLRAAAAVVDSAALLFGATDAVLTGVIQRAGDRADPDWRSLLRDAGASVPAGVAYLAAYKTNGRLIHRTGAPADHRESIATLDHFRTPIVTGALGLYVGRPYADSATGRTLVPLVRLHPGPGRALRAVLVAAVEAGALEERLSRQPGAMALARSDGTLLAVATAWAIDREPAGGALSAWEQGAVVEAANGLPLLAAATIVHGPAQAASHRHGIQLVAAALIASIGLGAFALLWRRPTRDTVSATAVARHGDDVAHAKSVLLATISHEFRTPLNAVIGFAEVIRDQASALPPEKVGEYAHDIAASGGRLLQMVNDVLDLSHIETGRYEIRPQQLDLVEIGESVNRVVAALAEERGVALAAPAIAEDLELAADRRAVMQILYNLVHNGVKYTEPGGTVSVTAVKCAEGTVRLDVMDDGVGIPEADLGRVMHPFEQSRDILTSSNGGTGLGLALVGKLTELHGGRVEIESRQGQGTVVSVYLPCEGSA